MTKSQRDAAIYRLAEYTANLPKQDKPKEWLLAEVKKYSTVREYIEKKNKTKYIYTAFGTHDGVTGYYSLDTSTEEITSGKKAEEMYFKSKTWYK